MAAQEEPSGTPDAIAQRTADRLALALEEVGFDVGRAFPMLVGVVGSDGIPVVELGQVSDAVAGRLAAVLEAAAQLDWVWSESPEGGT